MFGSAGRAYGSKAGLLCPAGVCGSLGMSAESMRVESRAHSAGVSALEGSLETVRLSDRQRGTTA